MNKKLEINIILFAKKFSPKVMKNNYSLSPFWQGPWGSCPRSEGPALGEVSHHSLWRISPFLPPRPFGQLFTVEGYLFAQFHSPNELLQINSLVWTWPLEARELRLRSVRKCGQWKDQPWVCVRNCCSKKKMICLSPHSSDRSQNWSSSFACRHESLEKEMSSKETNWSVTLWWWEGAKVQNLGLGRIVSSPWEGLILLHILRTSDRALF